MTLKELVIEMSHDNNDVYTRKVFSFSEQFSNIKKLYLNAFLCRDNLQSELRKEVTLKGNE